MTDTKLRLLKKFLLGKIAKVDLSAIEVEKKGKKEDEEVPVE